ncbi:MAG: TPM domain-containing protein [Bacteroidales bacterium]|nr:TPM domain-containing protein [Bacteroidales bacterium]
MGIGNTYRKAALIAIGAVFALCLGAVPSRPEPQRLVNDFAGLFTASQTEKLEHALVAFDDSTSNQITVVTVTDLEGYDASEYATRIGLDWGVGSDKFDNGIVFLVKPRTADSYGEIFIAVGYGLEGAIPDAYVKRIINGEIIPYFQNGDYYGGVAAGCDTLMKLASGEISEPRADDEMDSGVIAALIFLGFILLFVGIVLASKNGKGGGGNGGSGGRRVIYTGPVIRGGGFPTGGFGGGSFGGGGGFGGFGGGSFGGGGAGGRF